MLPKSRIRANFRLRYAVPCILVYGITIYLENFHSWLRCIFGRAVQKVAFILVSNRIKHGPENVSYSYFPKTSPLTKVNFQVSLESRASAPGF